MMTRVRQPPPNPRGLSPSPLPAEGRQGAAPAISGTFQILKGAQSLPKFLPSGGSPLTFDSYPSSPGGQLHRSSSGCGLPQAVMAGRESLLSFGFSSNRAQQAASAGNSGSLPLDPAPNSESGEIPGLEGKQGNEDLVDFTPLPESEPEEDSGFDSRETEDEEEAAAEDDELSQAAVHGQSASIDLNEDDGLGEALGFF